MQAWRLESVLAPAQAISALQDMPASGGGPRAEAALRSQEAASRSRDAAFHSQAGLAPPYRGGAGPLRSGCPRSRFGTGATTTHVTPYGCLGKQPPSPVPAGTQPPGRSFSAGKHTSSFPAGEQPACSLPVGKASHGEQGRNMRPPWKDRCQFIPAGATLSGAPGRTGSLGASGCNSGSGLSGRNGARGLPLSTGTKGLFPSARGLELSVSAKRSGLTRSTGRVGLASCSGRLESAAVRRLGVATPGRVSGLAVGREGSGLASKSMATASGAGAVVEFTYLELLGEPTARLHEKIEVAFGPRGAGIATVSGVPGYVERRERLLPLAPQLAMLPDEVKRELEDPESSWSTGWSHGREMLETGCVDTLKGSFYANPQFDSATDDPHLMQRYPHYCRANLWPKDVLPDLEPAFKTLGQLIVSVGILIARHCDAYVLSRNPLAEPGRLERIIATSRSTKGRLLHYFPPSAAGAEGEGPASAVGAPGGSPDVADGGGEAGGGGTRGELGGRGKDESQGGGRASKIAPWCGWHTDHGALTGLTRAMFFHDGREVCCADPDAGLYIRTRQDVVMKAVIPADHIGFQLGEVAQVHSGGLIQATPHFVRAAQGHRTIGVSRSTFAVFMQPNWDEPMDLPRGCADPKSAAVGQWAPGMDFGVFSERTIGRYYSLGGHDGVDSRSVPLV